MGRAVLRVTQLRLGEQQARLLHVAEQFVFGEDAVEAFRSEAVFATFKRQEKKRARIELPSPRSTGHT